MKNLIQKFITEEEGATMVEYGIMVAVIAIVALVGAELLGKAVDATFDKATAAMP